MDNPSTTEIVMPGDKLGVEEEFAPGDNTFADEDGSIRAAIAGYYSVDGGRINVHNKMHEIKKIEKGMLVIGTVTDDMHSVVFVKIGSAHINGVEHIATKDGKIVVIQKSHGPPGRDGPRGPPREAQGKLCGVGDVILAKVLFDDPEIYTLGVRDPECGVVHAKCELCGGDTRKGSEGALDCEECGHKQKRKLSTLFAKPDEIKRLFK